MDRNVKKQNKPGLILSNNEQLLLLNLQLNKDTTAYIEPLVLEIDGSIDDKRLQRAMDLLISNNETFRTYFIIDNGVSTRRIAEKSECKINVIDIPVCDNIEEKINNIVIEETKKGINISSAPLCKCCLIRVNENKSFVIIFIHHLICETHSLKLLANSIFDYYINIDDNITFDANEISLSDYCFWEQKTFYNSEEYKKQKKYWLDKLENKFSYLELPKMNNTNSQTISDSGKKCIIDIPVDISSEIKMYSSKKNIKYSSFFLSVIYLLLYKYTGSENILIAYPEIGRRIINTENIIGFIGNALLLRLKMTNDLTFEKITDLVEKELTASMENANISLYELIDHIAYEEETRSASYQIMVDYINSPLEAIEYPDFKVTPKYDIHNKTAKSEMSFAIYNFKDYFSVAIEYKSGLIHSSTIDYIKNDFLCVSAQVLKSDNLKVDELGTNTSENNIFQEKLELVNNNFVRFTDDDINMSIQEKFKQTAEKYPDRIAIKTDNYCFKYKELYNIAMNISRELDTKLTKGEKIVALLFEHDALMVCATLGVLFSGRIYVPLEKSFPKERHEYIIKDSDSSAILTDNMNIELAKELLGDNRVSMNIEENLNTESDDESYFNIVKCDSIAYILYTSGSTGTPKGVVQSHKNVLHHLRVWINNLKIGCDDRLSLFSSYGWDSAVSDTFSAILTGASLYPMDVKKTGFDIIIKKLMEEKITIIHMSVPLYRFMSEMFEENTTFEDVRILVMGGDLIYENDIKKYKKHFSNNTIMVNAYGSTESSTALMNVINKKYVLETSYLPLGYGVEKTNVLLRNRVGKVSIPYGIGEIVINSPYVAIGYNNKPDLYSDSFSLDSYNTGDLGQILPDGSILYLNRKDNVVKIRGFRIELGEIEAALKKYPLFKDVVVVSSIVYNEKSIIAYIVSQTGDNLDISEIKEYLKSKLPVFMIPAYFKFISSIPLTSSKKIDRKALPVIEESSVLLNEKYSSEAEKIISEIWKEILKNNSIKKSDNLFDVGGTSLHVLKIHSLMQKKLGINFPIVSLFEFPTIEKIARSFDKIENNKKNNYALRRANLRKMK